MLEDMRHGENSERLFQEFPWQGSVQTIAEETVRFMSGGGARLVLSRTAESQRTGTGPFHMRHHEVSPRPSASHQRARILC
jgi:hypothetical protein